MKRFTYLKQVNQSTDLSVAQNVLRDMRSRPDDQRFQLMCLRALNELSVKDKRKEKLLLYGVAPILLTTLRKHGRNLEIVVVVLEVISRLGGNCLCLLKMGFPSEILTVMDRNTEVAQIQEQACYAVRNLATCRPASETLSTLHVGDLIARAMSLHADSKGVQTAACAAVSLLCKVEQSNKALWMEGLGPKVLQAMKRFPIEVKLQEYACESLRIFSHPYSLMRLGALECLLSALEKHKTNERIATHSFLAIRGFALVQTNANLILQSRTLRVVVESMIRQFKKPKVQESGCLVFWSISVWEGALEVLVNADALTVVVETIRINFQEAIVVAGGCGFLTKMTTIESCAQQVKNLKGDEAIISGLQAHRDNEQLQLKGLCALRNVYFFEQLRPDREMATTVQRVVRQSARQFRRNEKIVSYIEQILESLFGNAAAKN